MGDWSMVGHALLAALLREPPFLTVIIAPLLVLIPVLAVEGVLLQLRPQSVLRRLRLSPELQAQPQPQPEPQRADLRDGDLRIEPGFAASVRTEQRVSAPVVAFRSRPPRLDERERD